MSEQKLSKDELIYRAQCEAIRNRYAVLKYGGLGLLILGGPMAFATAGWAGVAGVGAVLVGGFFSANQGADQDCEKLDRGDKRLLKQFTPRKLWPELYQAFAPGSDAAATLPAGKPIAPWEPSKFDAKALLDRGVGILLAGNPGSGKSTLARYILQQAAAPLIRLDPHFKAGVPVGDALVIQDKDAIIKAMEYLLTLIDKQDDRPLNILVGEVPSIRLYAKRQKRLDLVDEFILRFGAEARKYKKIAILESQSGNVKSFGLEGQGDFIESFTFIRLGKLAVKHAYTQPNREQYHWLNQQSYALTVDGQDAALHPCLGHHQMVDNSNAPIRLTEAKFPPLPADIRAALVGAIDDDDSVESPPGQSQRASQASSTPSSTTATCPSCESPETVKNGAGRRKCKACGVTFADHG